MQRSIRCAVGAEDIPLFQTSQRLYRFGLFFGQVWSRFQETVFRVRHAIQNPKTASWLPW